MPYRNGKVHPSATMWTQFMLNFLKAHFFKLTNPELAALLGLKLTVTRNKCRELGLKRFELEHWPDEMVQFLKTNYRLVGDAEIARIAQVRWPRLKRWTKKHIRKKRLYLNLKRTKDEAAKIASKNASPGGASYTIKKNSGSINLLNSWIAATITRKNPELKKEVLKNPELISAKKASIIKKRAKKQKIEKEKKLEEKRKLQQLLKEQELQRKKNRELQEQQMFKTKSIDYSQLVAVRVNNKTIIYAKPGEDPEVVKEKYLKTTASPSTNWKFRTGNDQ